MASFWVPRTGAILLIEDVDDEANPPLPIHIERTIPLYCILRTTSKLLRFLQQSIKLLVGILLEFFTPAKLTEIQRRISLLPHRIEACHSALILTVCS